MSLSIRGMKEKKNYNTTNARENFLMQRFHPRRMVTKGREERRTEGRKEGERKEKGKKK